MTARRFVARSIHRNVEKSSRRGCIEGSEAARSNQQPSTVRPLRSTQAGREL